MALTFPYDNMSSIAITLPPVILPVAFNVVGVKEPVITKLPTLTLPSVYILSPLTTPLAVTLPYENIS